MFFSPEKRDYVLDLYKTANDRERAGLKTLLQNINVILRVLGSREMIEIDDFKSFCLDTYALLNRMFPWMKISQSIHRYLAHGSDLIALNGSMGLAQLSEGPLESCHKILRRVRLNLSRMTNLGDNLDDTYGRLWMHASPQIRHQKPKKRTKALRNNAEYSDDEFINLFVQKDDYEQ